MLANLEPSPLIGESSPRIAPPRPLRHDLDEYRRVAGDLGIVPMEWQDVAATYVTAKGADDRFTFREVAIVVARQNGKTMLAKPLIIQRLLAGRRILHMAQVRQLPGMMFEEVAAFIEEQRPDLLPMRRGKIVWPRRARGDEAIVTNTGGSYRVVAAGTGAARGHSLDDLIIDELREMVDFSVTHAAGYTQNMSPNPQTIYLSNAGTDDSVILNSLRERAEGDPTLAYLEWSADPEYDAGDPRGWVQANPAIGPDRPWVLRELEQKYTAAKLGGDMAGFETESLCRWVKTMRPPVVNPDDWAACETPTTKRPVGRQHVAVAMDPEGTRASAAAAWLGSDGVCYLTLLADVKGHPIRTSLVGKEFRTLADTRKVAKVGYDSLTDAELAKHFRETKPIVGNEFANATSNFVRLVESGDLRWKDAGPVGDDLTWTARKENDETGSFIAVRANDDRPITAALAAIRAVWLATGVRLAKPRVY